MTRRAPWRLTVSRRARGAPLSTRRLKRTLQRTPAALRTDATSAVVLPDGSRVVSTRSAKIPLFGEAAEATPCPRAVASPTRIASAALVCSRSVTVRCTQPRGAADTRPHVAVVEAATPAPGWPPVEPPPGPGPAGAGAAPGTTAPPPVPSAP